MSLLEFFTGSGVLAWVYVVWRVYGMAAGLPRRLAWALWGHSKASRRELAGNK